jgi:hypothetical protein
VKVAAFNRCFSFRAPIWFTLTKKVARSRIDHGIPRSRKARDPGTGRTPRMCRAPRQAPIVQARHSAGKEPNYFDNGTDDACDLIDGSD